MTKTTHFKDNVDEKTQLKLLKLAENIQETIFDRHFDAIGEARIEEISGVAYDGYIPFQSGGYQVDSFFSNSQSSGNSFTENEALFNEEQANECLKTFKEENDIEESLDVPESLESQYWDYESEWLQPSLLRFEAWVERDGETAILRLSIGYKDAPYYRSKYDETIKEVTISVNELLEKDVSDLVKPFVEAI